MADETTPPTSTPSGGDTTLDGAVEAGASTYGANEWRLGDFTDMAAYREMVRDILTAAAPVFAAQLAVKLEANWNEGLGLGARNGREQAAQAIEVAGRDPHQNLNWMYPEEAARLARGGTPDSGGLPRATPVLIDLATPTPAGGEAAREWVEAHVPEARGMTAEQTALINESYAFVPAPPAEEPAGWTVSCGWRPTKRDPEPRDYPRSYLSWEDARQIGRTLACGDNVIAVTITAPDGSEAATWSRGGVWRETASPAEEPAQAGAVIAQALDHALEELQTLSARTASMHRRRGHLDAVGIISAALQAARPEAAEEPVPAGRTIRCVFEGGPADGLVPEVRYDSGGEMVPVPSPFIPWQVDGERFIYRYDRAEERDDGPVWVYVPNNQPTPANGDPS